MVVEITERLRRKAGSAFSEFEVLSEFDDYENTSVEPYFVYHVDHFVCEFPQGTPED